MLVYIKELIDKIANFTKHFIDTEGGDFLWMRKKK